MSLTEDRLKLAAQKRLDEVTQKLRGRPQGTSIYKHAKNNIDLIQERIQLRMILGELQERKPIGEAVSGNPSLNPHLEGKGMLIHFASEQCKPLYRHVNNGQMFVDIAGRLCMKDCEEENYAFVITYADGKPYGSHEFYDENTEIMRILPRISCISF